MPQHYNSGFTLIATTVLHGFRQVVDRVKDY